MPGFTLTDIETNGARIRLRHRGSGPPLLLLHGNPLTHVSWHAVAPRLAERFHVVAADLRGYGDSSAPPEEPDSANYSFRAMAQDQVEVMKTLGYDRFCVAGHDRGGRTTHRMCLANATRALQKSSYTAVIHASSSSTSSWSNNGMFGSSDLDFLFAFRRLLVGTRSGHSPFTIHHSAFTIHHSAATSAPRDRYPKITSRPVSDACLIASTRRCRSTAVSKVGWRFSPPPIA